MFLVDLVCCLSVFPSKPSHTYHHARPAHKKEEFRSVRCDSLGVRQNSLMI